MGTHTCTAATRRNPQELVYTGNPRRNWMIWGFPEMGVPQNGSVIMEHPVKVDDLGVPLFQETSI